MKTPTPLIVAVAAAAGALVGGCAVFGVTSNEQPADVPAACLAALDGADAILAANQDVSGGLSDLFDTMTPSAFGITVQADDLDVFTAVLEQATQDVLAADFRAPAAECRGEQ
jgi:hypothetical protein